MLLSDIQKRIMHILVEQDNVSTKDLHSEITKEDSKKSTLYYNINVLCGLSVRKRYGGVELVIAHSKTDFDNRLSVSPDQKSLLADYIIRKGLLPSRQSVLLDCGTTSFTIGEKIIEHKLTDMNILTINPQIVKQMIDYPEIGDITVIGGVLNRKSGAFFGPQTVYALEGIEAIDTAVLGVDSIDSAGIISINNSLEKYQKELIITKSQKILIPLISEKFGTKAPNKIGELKELIEHKQVIIVALQNAETDYPDIVQPLREMVGSENFHLVSE